jgi:ribosome-associated protein
LSDFEPISKTRRKTQMHELQDLGSTLVALKADQLARIDLPEELAEAVRFARTITKHEAKRRQLQYIGRLMREVDPDPIRAQLDALAGVSREARARQHWAEHWRERLVENDAALAALVAERPDAPRETLTGLVRDARRDRDQNRPPKAARELFRALTALYDGKRHTGDTTEP